MVYNVAFYSSSKYLPVATLGGVETCAVILCSAVMTAVIFHGLPLRNIFAAVLCVAGSILLLQPPFLFHGSLKIVTYPVCVSSLGNSSSDANDSTQMMVTSDITNEGISDEVTGYILLLLASFAASAELCLLNFPLKGSNAFMLSFWKGLVGTCVSAIPMAIFETPTFPSGAPCILLLFGHCISATWCTIFLTTCILLIPPLMAGILKSGQPVFFLLAQYTVLRHVNPGHQNAVEVVGAVIVVMGNAFGPVYQLFTEMKKDKKCADTNSDTMLTDFGVDSDNSDGDDDDSDEECN